MLCNSPEEQKSLIYSQFLMLRFLLLASRQVNLYCLSSASAYGRCWPFWPVQKAHVRIHNHLLRLGDHRAEWVTTINRVIKWERRLLRGPTHLNMNKPRVARGSWYSSHVQCLSLIGRNKVLKQKTCRPHWGLNRKSNVMVVQCLNPKPPAAKHAHIRVQHIKLEEYRNVLLCLYA